MKRYGTGMGIRTGMAALVVCSALFLLPSSVFACACGCGMFTVGMPGLGLPTKSGLAVNLQMILLDQNKAMHGSSSIPLSQSPDQRIRTTFNNLSVRYQINRSWGLMAMIPYWQRTFDTNVNFGAGPAQVRSYKVNSLADVRLEGIYSGFSPDMSTGLIFGLKLPTGRYTVPGFDRDTQPGSGSTDVLLGGYAWGQLAPNWSWFAQGMIRSAVSTRDGYHPGSSVHLVGGVHYDGFRFRDHFAPMLQLKANERMSDSGVNSDPADTGLRSLFIAPGIVFDLGRHWMANVNLYLPVYYHVTGIQLVPKQVFSFGVTYNM